MSTTYSDLIQAAIAASDTPLTATNRIELSNALGIVRNSTYLLQKEGKLPPPISPPIGSKFWYRYEVDALLLAMGNTSNDIAQLADELIESRAEIIPLIKKTRDLTLSAQTK